MDGAHDRPPGRTAENWSRKDRIRAGSVSGPWRSTPRAEASKDAGKDAAPPVTAPGTAPATAPDTAPVGAPVTAPVTAPVVGPVVGTGPVTPRPATPAARTAAVAPKPDRARAPAPEVRLSIRRPVRQGRAAMAAWVGFGVVFAAGCVGLAFLFQPQGQPAGPEDAASVEVRGPESAPAEVAGAGPGETALPAAGEAARVPTAEPVTIAGVTNVRLRTGTGFAADERGAVIAALAGAGLSDVQDEALPFAVASSRVGYYRPEDKAAAEALAAYIGPVLGYGGPIAVRDYGQLLDDAEPGRLDLWIGG